MQMGSEAAETASIRFLSGPLTGKVFPLTQVSTTFGRHHDNDIVIPDPRVSRNHARLILEEGIWRIERLPDGSDVEVEHENVTQATLKHLNVVELGRSSFLFVLPNVEVEESTAPIDDDDVPTLGDATVVVSSATLPVSVGVKGTEETAPIIVADDSRNTLASPEVQGEATLAIPSSNLPAMSATPPGDKKISARMVASGTEIVSFSDLGIASLEVTDHVSGGKRKYPLASSVVNVGRAESNEIVIDDPLVSDVHLQIVRKDDQWVLVYPHPDRQETLNGLLYQGRTLRSRRAFRKTLVAGDVFRIEDGNGNLVTMIYHDGSEAPRSLLPPLSPFPLDAVQVAIGRADDNDVVLSHPQVSAHHLRLTREKDTYRLTDLNSSNHTYVNGIQASTLLLVPEDEIRLGPFRLVFTGGELRQYDESTSIGIEAVDLRKTGNNQAVLLNNISLNIPPRSFVALVGSSGAGKSTLMDALSGSRPAQKGVVYYNGQDYYRHLSAFRSQLGYVPQEDIIHRDLTVERALYYAAQLRLPEDFTAQQIEQRITEVLEDVEMTARRKLLIKKLSGGQRKRVSIALELLAKPSIFFLDEPTSGLDPGLDRKMMILLRKLADKGHTVVLVTHATNNINVCDAVCFLAQGGRLAYFGPPEEAKVYFQQPDFAEIYNFLEPTDEDPDVPQQVETAFKQSPEYREYIAQPLAGQRVQVETQNQARRSGREHTSKSGNPWKQFLVLSWRYLELLWNDKGNLAILLLQAPIIGIVLFIVVHSLNDLDVFHPPVPYVRVGDAQRFLFIMSFAALMFGCINSAREIIKEANIYRRERAVNLGIAPYLFSKVIILSAICLVQCLILLLFMNLAATFYNGIILPDFAEFYITLVLVAIAGVMIGLTISALVRSNDQAMSFVPLVLIPEIVFSGGTFPLKNIPLQVVGWFFSMRWGMAAMGSTLNMANVGDNLLGTCASCGINHHDLNYLLLTWLALVGTIVALAALTAYVIRRKDRES